MIDIVDRQIHAYRKQIEKLERIVASRDETIIDLNNQISERDARIAELETVTHWQRTGKDSYFDVIERNTFVPDSDWKAFVPGRREEIEKINAIHVLETKYIGWVCIKISEDLDEIENAYAAFIVTYHLTDNRRALGEPRLFDTEKEAATAWESSFAKFKKEQG